MVNCNIFELFIGHIQNVIIVTWSIKVIMLCHLAAPFSPQPTNYTSIYILLHAIRDDDVSAHTFTHVSRHKLKPVSWNCFFFPIRCRWRANKNTRDLGTASSKCLLVTFNIFIVICCWTNLFQLPEVKSGISIHMTYLNLSTTTNCDSATAILYRIS